MNKLYGGFICLALIFSLSVSQTAQAEIDLNLPGIQKSAVLTVTDQDLKSAIETLFQTQSIANQYIKSATAKIKPDGVATSVILVRPNNWTLTANLIPYITENQDLKFKIDKVKVGWFRVPAIFVDNILRSAFKYDSNSWSLRLDYPELTFSNLTLAEGQAKITVSKFETKNKTKE